MAKDIFDLKGKIFGDSFLARDILEDCHLAVKIPPLARAAAKVADLPWWPMITA